MSYESKEAYLSQSREFRSSLRFGPKDSPRGIIGLGLTVLEDASDLWLESVRDAIASSSQSSGCDEIMNPREMLGSAIRQIDRLGALFVELAEGAGVDLGQASPRWLRERVQDQLDGYREALELMRAAVNERETFDRDLRRDESLLTVAARAVVNPRNLFRWGARMMTNDQHIKSIIDVAEKRVKQAMDDLSTETDQLLLDLWTNEVERAIRRPRRGRSTTSQRRQQ